MPVKSRPSAGNRRDELDDEHRGAVDPAASVAGCRSDNEADHACAGADDEADEDRCPDPIERPAEDVVPDAVRAEEVRTAEAWWSVHAVDVEMLIRVRRDPVSEEACAEDDRDDSECDERDPLSSEPAQGLRCVAVRTKRLGPVLTRAFVGELGHRSVSGFGGLLAGGCAATGRRRRSTLSSTLAVDTLAGAVRARCVDAKCWARLRGCAVDRNEGSVRIHRIDRLVAVEIARDPGGEQVVRPRAGYCGGDVIVASRPDGSTCQDLPQPCRSEDNVLEEHAIEIGRHRHACSLPTGNAERLGGLLRRRRGGFGLRLRRGSGTSASATASGDCQNADRESHNESPSQPHVGTTRPVGPLLRLRSSRSCCST